MLCDDIYKLLFRTSFLIKYSCIIVEINVDTALSFQYVFYTTFISSYNFITVISRYNAFNSRTRSRNQIPKLRCNLKYSLRNFCDIALRYTVRKFLWRLTLGNRDAWLSRKLSNAKFNSHWARENTKSLIRAVIKAHCCNDALAGETASVSMQ